MRKTTKDPRRRNGCGREEAETRFVLFFWHQLNLPGVTGSNHQAALEGHTDAGHSVGIVRVTGMASQVDSRFPEYSREDPRLYLGVAALVEFLDGLADAVRMRATLAA